MELETKMCYNQRSRILDRKSYKICPMCRGKGYFDDSSMAQNKANMNQMQAPYEGTQTVKKDGAQNLDEGEMGCRQSGDMDLLSSVPQLPILETKGGSVRNKGIQQLKTNSMLLPNKFRTAQRKKSYEKGLNHSPSSSRNTNLKSMSKLKSFGSGSSVNSDASDLLQMDRQLGNPREALKQALAKIKNNNWDMAMSGLEELAILCSQLPQESKIIRTELEMLNCSSVACAGPIIDWDTVGRAMTKLVASFHLQKTRSVRLTCQILKELFKLMTTSVHRPQFDNAVNELIKRTADTSKMVRYDAHQALDTMIKQVPIQFSIRAILSQAPRHKNPVVRQTAMRLIQAIIEEVTPQLLLTQLQMKESRKQVINALCSLIDDQNQHVRWLVRETLQSLMSQEMFEEIMNNDVEAQVLKRADRSLILLQYNTDIG